MTEVVLTPEVTWLVSAFRMPDEETAARRWREIDDGGAENVSCWRTTSPDRTIHLIVLCGRREDVEAVEVADGGVPYDLDRVSAMHFALRRARVGTEAFADGSRERHTQRAHYPDGAFIEDDGSVR